MTMLDRMRRHKGWLKWSLGIVVVTFVLLYVPAFLRGGSGDGSSPTDTIASIDGHELTVAEFQRAYQSQVDNFRAANGSTAIDDQMLKQLGMPQRVMQSLLDMQRPPLSEAQFESDLRGSLMAEKLQAAVTGWMRVSDAEVDEAYRKQNEKVKLDLALFTANDYRKGIEPTDAELSAQFAAHPDNYKVPEKRRVKYLSIDAEALKARQTVTPQEVQQRYNANLQMYSTPEQVRASHILFKTDGKNDAAQMKKAQDVLAKVKAGGDFAALAKQYSEDDASKVNGGDLDYFGKGTMFKEFEDVVWNMKPSQISDVTKSPAGLHIIKFVDRRPATTKTLAQVT